MSPYSFYFGIKGEDKYLKKVKKDNYSYPKIYNIKDSITGKLLLLFILEIVMEKKVIILELGSYKILAAFDYLITSTRENVPWNHNFRYV